VNRPKSGGGREGGGSLGQENIGGKRNCCQNGCTHEGEEKGKEASRVLVCNTEEMQTTRKKSRSGGVFSLFRRRKEIAIIFANRQAALEGGGSKELERRRGEGEELLHSINMITHDAPLTGDGSSIGKRKHKKPGGRCVGGEDPQITMFRKFTRGELKSMNPKFKAQVTDSDQASRQKYSQGLTQERTTSATSRL